jgi:hypothetical protein
MRIIVNEELLNDEGFLSLSKTETDRLLKIIFAIAKNDKGEVSFNYLNSNFGLSDDFIEKTRFCLNYGTSVSIVKYFKWFSSNKEYVAKSRSKAKLPKEEVIIETPKVVEEPNNIVKVEVKEVDIEKEKRENVDYDRVVDIFNNCFKDTKVPSIKVLSDGRKKTIKSFFTKMNKDIKCEDIYEFYDSYFEVIKDVGDKKLNLVKGWNNPRSNTWFQPDFDYFLKDKVYVQVREKALV